MGKPWIGVDLDGTWAKYFGWKPDGGVGEPIPIMTEKIKRILDDGEYDVKVFTARVGPGRYPAEAEEQRTIIEAWTEQVLGRKLEVTATKDFDCVEIWDDRARQIMYNTGLTWQEYQEAKMARAMGQGR